MPLTHFGFIYTAAGADPDRDVAVVDTGQCKTVLVGMSSPDRVVEVARRLVDDGAQLIELCGGFGPLWTSRVLEAVGDQIPVGSVAYGPESIDGVHALFS